MDDQVKSQLDILLAPVRAMELPEQLKFWKALRTKHRNHVSNAEAQLCPELLKTIDEHINNLRLTIAQGV